MSPQNSNLLQNKPTFLINMDTSKQTNQPNKPTKQTNQQTNQTNQPTNKPTKQTNHPLTQLTINLNSCCSFNIK